MFHIVTAGQRALGGFGPRRADGLAHFERHDAAEFVLLRFQDARRGGQPAGAIGQRRTPIAAPSSVCSFNLVVNLRDGQRLENAQRFPGSGIDGGYHSSILRGADHSSVFRRPLRMIDNKRIQRRLHRLQLQPKLLMQSFLECRCFLKRRCWKTIRLNVLSRRRRHLRFQSEFEREIEPPTKPRLLHGRPIQSSERTK